MKYKKVTLENGLEKEWLITNGIGGYASSTVLNCNTRKYHGLLIAPFTPPARRFLILSKVDESIKIGEDSFNLYTNICPNYISNGYKYLKEFEKEYIPTFTYQVQDVNIQKSICMQYGKNTVGILYKVKNVNEKMKLTIAPIVNFRDFHRMNDNHEYNIRQENKNQKVKVVVDGNSGYPIYMNTSEGEYIPHEKDIFHNMYYIEEEKRGFYPQENHLVPRKI